ncbi:MAG: hypothetical protein JNL71_03445 [Rhodospirillales bacterium]|nr:hypothetical protein [Rhodospirillales bacterium]
MRLKALALAGLILATPAFAQSTTVPPEALAREAIEKMILALQGVIANLPQYAAPEIDADGNITIRRLNPPRNLGKAPAPKDPGLTL